MREWSTYCQNADYLEKSRMLIMNRDMASQILGWIGVKSGDVVLDVGCGSGELTLYLANVSDAVSYTGVDLDMPLLERARQKADTYSGTCSLSFVEGNALDLPFADGSFDAVVSQTFFTSIADYEKAMQEMCRVCRSGGRIATLTPLSFNQIYNHSGSFPVDATWVASYQQSLEKMERLYGACGTTGQYVTGIVPMKIPEMFAKAGLQSVSAYPIGTFLSLSNDAMSKEDKQRYILLDYKSELDRFQAHMRLSEAENWVSEDEAKQIEETLAKRRDYLLEHLDDNAIWEWIGSTLLLVVGVNAENQHNFASEELERLRLETGKYKAIFEALNIETEEKWHHSGAGRTASVRVSISGADISAQGIGITPVHALLHGYSSLVALLATFSFFEYDTELWNLAPNEKLLTANELEQLSGPLLEESLALASKGPGAPIIDIRTTAQKLSAWDFAAYNGKFKCLPFESKNNGSLEWLPEVLCEAYYGNNGSSAGLTEQEAILNALCNVAERYAARKILLEGQTPPLIPNEIVHTLSEVLQEAVFALQHKHNLCLRIMDASCGIGLPVIAAMLIDQQRGTAKVCFGAHPKVEDALAHSIAGLMAEQNYDKPMNMSGFDMLDSKTINYPRQFNLMNGNLDMYPASLLSPNSSWDYRPWKDAANDVAGQLDQLQSLFDELKWDYYLRRCGLLDIAAVQVIVPGVSMLHDFGAVRLQERRMAAAVKHVFRNMLSSTPEERKRAAQYAQLKMAWQRENSFLSLSGIPIIPVVLGVPLDATMIYALVQLNDGAYDAALSALKCYIGASSAIHVLFDMVRAIQDGRRIEDAKAQLSVLYSDSLAKEAERILRNPLAAFPALNCPECHKCSKQNNCKMQNTLKLMRCVIDSRENNKIY